MWAGAQSGASIAPNLRAMAMKYFAHFVTGADVARQANEWSGVIELAEPLEGRRSAQRDLRRLLAESFELDVEEVRILQWARLQ